MIARSARPYATSQHLHDALHCWWPRSALPTTNAAATLGAAFCGASISATRGAIAILGTGSCACFFFPSGPEFLLRGNRSYDVKMALIILSAVSWPPTHKTSSRAPAQSYATGVVLRRPQL